tara:strand:- start:1271 stop:1732 length:462 start_codon:yes stop_codon:yes gene_type:complete
MKPILLLLSFGLVSLSVVLRAQSSKESTGSTNRFEMFSESMTQVRFKGFFTVNGSKRPPLEETYEIHSVQKFGDEDLWIFTARIKSGNKDVTLPMPLPVKWVGEIPVISMQDFTIPGLGTFSAHVVIDRDKYAGTWAHGNKGGHLYGTISKIR